VSGTPDDPSKPQRQLRYFRALKTLSKVELIPGIFYTGKAVMQRADNSGPIEVVETREKRSDVNLASKMLWDAHCNNFDTAVLISGDSDFLTPMNMINHPDYFNKKTVVLDPSRQSTPKSELNKSANLYKPIRAGALAAAQFDIILKDAKGSFSPPATWLRDQLAPTTSKIQGK
jgi:NYN domain